MKAFVAFFLLAPALVLAQARPHSSGGAGITIASGIGSSPNAAGMSLSAGTLTLQPADATHPGVVTTGDQTFSGNKTFAGNIILSGFSFVSAAAGFGTGGNGGASQGMQFSGSDTNIVAAGDSFHVGLASNSGKNFVKGGLGGITKLGDNGGTNEPSITMGTGSPAGVVTANPGSLYLRTDGAAGTTLYVKESGTGTSGWAAK